jgi:hypothetical protein
MLSDLNLIMEVHQEYGDRERILLGIVRVNLAEYAGLEKETRRYLMQDSKINSTVKVGIEMHQIGGDTNFQAPQLKGAQVFAGIAGIINEQRETDDSRSTSHPLLCLTLSLLLLSPNSTPRPSIIPDPCHPVMLI